MPAAVAAVEVDEDVGPPSAGPCFYGLNTLGAVVGCLLAISSCSKPSARAGRCGVQPRSVPVWRSVHWLGRGRRPSRRSPG